MGGVGLFFAIIAVLWVLDLVMKVAAQAQEEARRRQLEARRGQDGPTRPAEAPPRDDLEAFLRGLVDPEAARPKAPAAPPPKRVVLKARKVEPPPARPQRVEDRHLHAAVEGRHLEASVERRHLHASVEDRHLTGVVDERRLEAEVERRTLETNVDEILAGKTQNVRGVPGTSDLASGVVLARLERLPLLARSMILAELFGTPPGLRGRLGAPARRRTRTLG